MSTLLMDLITPLDGHAGTDGSWPAFWGLEGPEYLAFLEEDGKVDHTLIMGANTYRLMHGYATDAGDDPGLAAMTARRKVVFSSTLEAPLQWKNAELITSDAVEAIRAMKQRETQPLRTVGSISLCRSLLNAGLVDRMRIVIFPLITGATGTVELIRSPGQVAKHYALSDFGSQASKVVGVS